MSAKTRNSSPHVLKVRKSRLAADLICRDDGRTGTTLARPGIDRLLVWCMDAYNCHKLK
jgi:hypothetical protein